MTDFIEILSREELAQELLEKERENVKLIIQKLRMLEKSSQEKLNWAKQFSNYLQKNINIK